MNLYKVISVSGRSRDVQIVRSNPPFEIYINFIFMESFQKNQEKIINYRINLTNQPPHAHTHFVNLNPLSKNPGSGPECTQDKSV